MKKYGPFEILVCRTIGHCLILLISVFFSVVRVAAQQNKVKSTSLLEPGEVYTRILNGNIPPVARPDFDHGAAPADLLLTRALLVLRRTSQQESAVEQLLQEQQTRSSPNYHLWLTPQEFGQLFGPSDDDIHAVTSWLASQGLQVNLLSKSRTLIEFSGTAGQIKGAFRTEIHKYVVNGEEHWANSSDPQIPAALAPLIAGIVSLNNFPRKPLHRNLGLFGRDTETGGYRAIASQENSLFTAGGGCGLKGTSCYIVAPYDLATIYNILPLWNANPPIDGTGQHIAIVAQSDIYPQDVSDFHSIFGLPAPSLNIIHNGPDPGKLATEGDEAESDLDVEWSSAIAKGATIDFVVSASTNSTAGVDLSAEYIVDNDIAPVMSESYGACELDMGTAGNHFYNELWKQAAAEGITVFVATGDSGSDVCDRDAPIATQGLSVNGIASTPYNVAVGGTDFNDLQNPALYWNSSNSSGTQASVKGYIPEMTWNDTCTNSEFFQLDGSSTAELDCNDATSTFWPNFLVPVGGSGGASNCTTPSGQSQSTCAGGYSKPSWQSGAGVPNDGKRDVPDVSLFAADGLNASFYGICETDIYGGCGSDPHNIVGIGGTSAAAPIWAAIMAMVNQKTQSRQGNANFVLYPLAAKAGSSCDSSGTIGNSCTFYDVTAGTIAMPCTIGTPNCVTNTIGDQNGLLSGYDAAKGYDLATGLGTVNVANLVNNWDSVSFQPTLTTLSLNPISQITHGSAINVDITVAAKSGSGTPTGQVSLRTSTGKDVGTFTLANGSANETTGLLPGGSYSVSAHYAGDGTYGGSDSSPGINVVVDPEQSQTTVEALTIDQNGDSVPFMSGPYGSQVVYLRTSVAGQSAQGAPSGTVNLAETFNGTTTTFAGDPFALNVEGYTITPLPIAEYPFFNAGTYYFSAAYSGDGSFNASTSSATGFTITKAQTDTALSGPCVSSGPCDIQPGSINTIFAFVNTNSSPFSNLPTGTVTFFSNGSQLGDPVAIDSHIVPPVAGFSTTQLPLGPNNITARYNGDANYSSSTAAAIVVGVGEGFAITANPTAINIASPGQSGSTILTFTPQNGLTGSATLSASSCSYLPPQSTCSFNPSTVTFTSTTTSVPLTLTINTTGPSSTAGYIQHPDFMFPSGLGQLSIIWLLGAAALCVLSPSRRTVRKVLTTFVIAAASFGISCGGGNSNVVNTGTGNSGGGSGGGGSNSGTPPGTYYGVMVTVQINGAGQYVAFNVNVQ